MSQTSQESGVRGHFKNIVNTEDVPAEWWGQDAGSFAVTSREIAISLGAKDLGFCVVTLEPGKRSCPFHFHHSEEELFYVLKGHARLRQGDDETEEVLELGPGDFASFPPDTCIAHQFINHTEEPFVYMAISTRHAHDVAEYPDSNKVLVRGTRLMLRRTPPLEYFDGEV